MGEGEFRGEIFHGGRESSGAGGRRLSAGKNGVKCSIRKFWEKENLVKGADWDREFLGGDGEVGGAEETEGNGGAWGDA